MLEVEDAQQRIISTIEPLAIETVSLREADRRVSAQSVSAPISLPPFDNSAMDGYAARAADFLNASADTPVLLKCIGAVAAGATFANHVEPKTCVRLFTGSPLPSGADAVVMQEDTRANGDLIEVLDSVKPWENVRLAGEDVKHGATIVCAGEWLNAVRLALVGAVGIESVQVVARPIIGILSTGNELIEPGQPLAPGQIYESNRFMIASLIAEAGGVVRRF